jgi:hypothetical protein
MVTHNQVIPQPCRFLATGAEDGPLGGCARCPGNFYRAITHATSVPNRPSAVKRRRQAPGLSSVAKAVGTQPVSLVERVAMRTPLTPGPAAQSAPTQETLVGDARCVVGGASGEHEDDEHKRHLRGTSPDRHSQAAHSFIVLARAECEPVPLLVPLADSNQGPRVRSVYGPKYPHQ